MNGKITVFQGGCPGGTLPELFTEEAGREAGEFHRSLREYEETPLAVLDSMAKKLGLGGIYVKDESKRFGLNAFKALGASYAVHKLLEEEAARGGCGETVNPAFPGGKDKVFVTATDGNHGKGVAWAAWKAGGRAFVFMPKGSRPCRADAIASMGGARVTVTDWNYDDTVRHAWAFAKENGYYFVQDTAFDGYTRIPNLIAQGYLTMAREALDQLRENGVERPTHVFLQAGVGTMAGAVLGYYANRFDGKPPIASIIEADESACVLASAKAGERTAVGGNPRTVMAGLNCGEVNLCTWPVLRDFASFYVSCPDWVTVEGMKAFAHPVGEDRAVVSGESGAVGLGLIMSLCTKPEYADIRTAMGLDENSRVLLFSTEGNTDPEYYEEMISLS